MKPVVNLVNAKAVEGNSNCVEILERMLEEARQGKMTGVAIAAADSAGYVISNWRSTENGYLLIGAMERMKFRMISHLEDE